MPDAQSLKDLMRIRAHNRGLLDSINGTLGTALGFKKPTGEPVSDEPAVIVFVPRKINPKWIPGSQLIPQRLDGPDGLSCPLDVVEGGRAETEKDVPPAVDELAERLRGWDDQVWAGSQISHWIDPDLGSYSIGTLGAFTRSGTDDTLGFLTNQHVGIQPGQKLYHPVPWGTHLASTERVVEYVADQNWYGPLVDEPSTFVRVDCAFARLEPSFNVADINPHLMGVGELGSVKNISLDDMSIIGQKVLRVGRTTGLRRGTIVAFGYEYVDESNVTVYTDLLIVGENDIPFSTHGDSGSLIATDDDELNPIGLLWGGWQEKLRTGHAQENWTYGIALSRVLDALDINLVSSLD
ncbi:hypothetical protein MYX75_04995 [Acidobacteria bacterium AH-259-A15]|nr:hypothetical protein [Acidobacteria bacterium AH-259-A15]